MSENTTTDTLTAQMSAFQKIWMETFSRLTQTAFASGPEAVPPEVLRQMRNGIFQALAQSWDEYLRSPQFMQGMKQWMDGAIFFRKMTNDMLTKARHETQDVAREDIDTVLLSIRHLEQRILDRIEELASRLDAMEHSNGNGAAAGSVKPPSAASPTQPRSATRPRIRKTSRPKKPKPQL